MHLACVHAWMMVGLWVVCYLYVDCVCLCVGGCEVCLCVGGCEVCLCPLQLQLKLANQKWKARCRVEKHEQLWQDNDVRL